jgi:sugar lactone lactonase YvrE
MKMKRPISFLAGMLVVIGIPASARAQSPAPNVTYDPSFPKLPLQNRWVLGQLGGVCVDRQGHVVVNNRGQTDDTALDAGVNAPPIIEFDVEGNVVRAWGDMEILGGGHGCAFDGEDNLWTVGGGGVKKFTHDGKLLLEIEGPNNEEYGPEGVAIDPQNGDAYINDSEGQRVFVVDRAGKFLRQFKLNRAPDEAAIPHVLHCIGFANDGLVYVCDRRAFRVQVFDRMGNFKQNIPVPWKPYTSPDGRQASGVYGSASSLAFSPDPAQRFLFATNEDNSQVEVLDRLSGRHLKSFGFGYGSFPGQFQHVHGIAVDSRGNIYTAETGPGQRVQRWKMAP